MMPTETFVWPEFLDVAARSACAVQTQNAAGFGGRVFLFRPANGDKPVLLTVTDNLAAAAGLIYAGRFYRGQISAEDAHTVHLSEPGGPLRLERSEVQPVTITPLTPAD